MANFVLAYHGTVRPGSEAEMNEMLAEWGAWFGQLGAALVDPGAPFGNVKTVSSTSVKDGVSGDPATGYSVVKADSFDAAAELAKGCPLIKRGSLVVVYECLPIPGM